MNSPQKIGKNMRKLRGGLSRKELANSLGISQSAISMYERGERMPRDNIKRKIADYFGQSVQSIFFDDSEHI